jgi:hypothetical protein
LKRQLWPTKVGLNSGLANRVSGGNVPGRLSQSFALSRLGAWATVPSRLLRTQESMTGDKEPEFAGPKNSPESREFPNK